MTNETTTSDAAPDQEHLRLVKAHEAAQMTHDLAKERRLALEAVKAAYQSFEDAADDSALTEADRTIVKPCLRPAVWLAMQDAVKAARAAESDAEDVAHDARQAIRAYETEHPEVDKY